MNSMKYEYGMERVDEMTLSDNDLELLKKSLRVFEKNPRNSEVESVVNLNVFELWEQLQKYDGMGSYIARTRQFLCQEVSDCHFCRQRAAHRLQSYCHLNSRYILLIE